MPGTPREGCARKSSGQHSGEQRSEILPTSIMTTLTIMCHRNNSRQGSRMMVSSTSSRTGISDRSDWTSPEKSRADPQVSCAEPKYIVSVPVIPRGKTFSEQWELHNLGHTNGTPDAKFDAPYTWQMPTGSHDIIVGVIDTGATSTESAPCHTTDSGRANSFSGEGSSMPSS